MVAMSTRCRRAWRHTPLARATDNALRPTETVGRNGFSLTSMCTYGQCRLQQQDEGNAIAEFQVPAFVPHDEDGNHRAHRTAYGCQGEERELGDAPRMTLGLDLVDDIDREREHVDRQQVYPEELRHHFLGYPMG